MPIREHAPDARCSDAVAELLHRTRVERGLPPTIEDPAVVDRVAAIVAAGEVADDGVA